MSEHYLDDFDHDLTRAATGFGGGLGGSKKELCGAVSGGTIAIGLIHGRRRLDEDKSICYRAAETYRARFEEHFGTTCCGDLRAGDYGGDGIPCYELVAEAVPLLLEILDKA